MFASDLNAMEKDKIEEDTESIRERIQSNQVTKNTVSPLLFITTEDHLSEKFVFSLFTIFI